MRSLLVPTIFAFLYVSQAIAAETWVQVSDPNGNFTVEFPTKPEVTTEESRSPKGKIFPITTYALERGAIEMAVSDSHLWPEASFADILPREIQYDLAVETLAMDLGTILTNEPDILNEQDGRRAVFSGSTGVTYTFRMFSFGGHMFNVLTGVAQDATEAQKAQAARFLASFQLKTK